MLKIKSISILQIKVMTNILFKDGMGEKAGGDGLVQKNQFYICQ
mgnify:CR=1 FL=1